VRGWRTAFVLVVACYGPHAETGAPCEPKTHLCPAGQMCVLEVDSYVCDTAPGAGSNPIDAPMPPIDAVVTPPDSPSYDATPTDLDGDGIPNTADNCPTTPNPQQENEDSDAFGDACDPCPPIADDAPPDSDSDGVADACDPRPTQGGDTIVLFEGFHAALPGGWNQSGTWTIASDAASTDATGGRATLTIAGATTGHVSVSTAFTLDALNGSADASVGVVDAYDHTASPRKGVHCHLTDWGSSSPLAVVPLHDAPEHDAPYQITVGRSYTLQQRHDGSNYTCSAQSGAAQQTVTVTSGLAPATPEVGFRITHAAATFKWLLVVSNP